MNASAWSWDELNDDGKLAWAYFYAHGHLTDLGLEPPESLTAALNAQFDRWTSTFSPEEESERGLTADRAAMIRDAPRVVVKDLAPELLIEEAEVRRLLAEWERLSPAEIICFVHRLAVMDCLHADGSLTTELLASAIEACPDRQEPRGNDA